MPVQENITRNKEIVRRYKPFKMGYKKLGLIYSVDWSVIRDIVKREKARKMVGVQKKERA